MHKSQQSEEELLNEAIALPVAEREAFLNHACNGAEDLRRRMQSLLRAYETAGDFMEETPPEAADVSQILHEQAPTEDTPGQQIGRYKLLERLGEGGCGIVYLVEQEEPVRRRVALKVIKLGMDTRAVIARFEAERQALALMEHPNIARVFDAGATASGRPYFVMEWVRGRKITVFCDEENFTVEKRVRLMIDVCQAVQHAHQKGIIHRDLKPSNILVTSTDNGPVPVVIDFGIVKATQGTLTEKTLVTAYEQFIGTPAYVSPEQVQGIVGDVDTRSDVYSLGVLLYELLIGRTPFDGQELARAGFEAMRKTILETEPPRPSTRLTSMIDSERNRIAALRSVEPAKLSQLVRGDLDWIIMRCIEKDRARRYESASALARDLRRHLANETVLARPPSRVYQLERFARRNRTWVIASTTIAIVVVAGLILASVGFARAKVQQRAAEAARREAEDLVSFMVKDLRPELQRVGRLPLTAQVAEQAVRYFSHLPPDFHNASTERNRATALESLAYVRSQAGNSESAASLWHEALAARRRAAATAPGDPLIAVELALTEILDLSPGYPLVLSQAPGPGSPEIDARLAAIVDRARNACRNHLSNHEVSRLFARVLACRSSYLCGSSSRPDEALAIGREAEAIYRNLLARSPRDTSLDTEFVQLLSTIAEAAQQAGSFETAIQVAEESLAFANSALEKNPGNSELREKAAFTAMQLSFRVSPVSGERARAAEAIARERWRELMQMDPQNFSYRHQYAWAHLAECHFLRWEAGRIVEAREATERFIELLSPVAQSPTDFRGLRSASFRLGEIAANLGDRAEAQKQIDQAHDWHRRYLLSLSPGVAEQPTVRAQYLHEYGVVLEGLEDWAEAERLSRAQVDAVTEAQRLEPGLQTFSIDSAVAKNRIGYALLRQRLAHRAVPILRNAIEELKDSEARNLDVILRKEILLETEAFLAEALLSIGSDQEAQALLEKNITGWDEIVSAKPAWEARRHLADGIFLLATALDSSEPRGAARRHALLERASSILKAHAAETPLTLRETELLEKVEALRTDDHTDDTEVVPPFVR